MKYINLFLIIVLFGGCGIVDLEYQSQKDNIPEYQQKVENQECTYLLGPFDIKNKETLFSLEKDEALEKLINDTIKKANRDGLYGNKLINVDIKEGGYTSPFASKVCLYISANLVYDKFLEISDIATE